VNVDEPSLLQRSREGDEMAFAELYQRHQRPIYRYAARMCGPGSADEVVQDTFMAVLRTGKGFDASRGTFRAYLFGVARHMVLKRLGSRYDTAVTTESDVPDVPLPPDVLDTLAQQERVAAVRTAVQSLPPAYREVVALCDLAEIEYSSAAQIIGCPVGTVRSRLHRARALLVSKLASLREAHRS
jgi:RNA polymerase sigma-70 factor (ECF subfamily)